MTWDSAAPLFGVDTDRLASTTAALQVHLGEQQHRRCLARGAATTDDDAVMFAAAEIGRATRCRTR